MQHWTRSLPREIPLPAAGAWVKLRNLAATLVDGQLQVCLHQPASSTAGGLLLPPVHEPIIFRVSVLAQEIHAILGSSGGLAVCLYELCRLAAICDDMLCKTLFGPPCRG